MGGEFYARRAGEQMEQKALMEASAAATSQEFYTALPPIASLTHPMKKNADL